MEGPGEEEEPEQDPTVEPEAEAAGSAAQPPSGRVIADFITSPEGVKTGWEVRGIHAKYTPAKVDPKAPWRKQVKKQIWGQVKKHPEPKSGFRLRSRVSASVSEAQGPGQVAEEAGCHYRRPEEAHQGLRKGTPAARDQGRAGRAESPQQREASQEEE